MSDHDHGAFAAGPPGRLQDLLHRRTGRELVGDLRLAQRLGGLAGANRWAGDEDIVLRQALLEPLGDASRLLASLLGEATREIGAAVFRVRVPPEDKFHGAV